MIRSIAFHPKAMNDIIELYCMAGLLTCFRCSAFPVFTITSG